jgi:hypothetical protein
MNCKNCGQENPNDAEVCYRCGYGLQRGARISWASAIFFTVLGTLFLPIGVCGAFVVTNALLHPPQSDYDMTFYAIPFVIGVPSMLIGFGVVYLIARHIFKR